MKFHSILVVLSLIIQTSLVFPAHEICDKPFSKRAGALTPDIYYINLDRSTGRKSFMEQQLHFYGLSSSTRRVRAYIPNELFIPADIKAPQECKFFKGQAKLSKDSRHRVFIDGHCGRPKNSKRELTTTASHLRALYTAVHTNPKTSSSSPYALILEDDLQLVFDIDWAALVATAPTDFVVLQLVTSNERDMTLLYNDYKRSGGKYIWHQRVDKNDFWCAGGYLVHKDRLRKIVDRIVHPLPAPLSTAENYLKDTISSIMSSIPDIPEERLSMSVVAGYSDAPNAIIQCWPEDCCSPNPTITMPHSERSKGYENIGRFIIGGSSLINASAAASSVTPEPNISLSAPVNPACIFAPRGYQADHYIFSLARRFTYMLTVPMFGGTRVGNTSTMHQEHVNKLHVGAFGKIATIHSDMIAARGMTGKKAVLVPPFISLNCSRYSLQ